MTHVFTTAGYQVESICTYCYMWMICSLLARVDQDLGEAKKVLGMEIERDMNNGKVRLTQVRLTQKGYLQKVLQKFNISGDTKSVSIPLAPYFKLRATMSPTTVEVHEYMSYCMPIQ